MFQVLSFYKGVLSPIVAKAPINAVMWTTNGIAKRFLQDFSASANVKHFLAGSFAGV